jgi:hypothetical protein
MNRSSSRIPAASRCGSDRRTSWCCGLFHGDAGAAAREAFAEIFGEVPTDIDEESLFWRKAIDAAIAATRTIEPAHVPSDVCDPLFGLKSSG